MAHEYQGCIGRNSCLRNYSLRNCQFVVVDVSSGCAYFTEQRLSNGDRHLVHIGLKGLDQLVILCAVHQVCRLYDQCLNAVCYSALQSLLHVVDLFAVTRVDMVDDDLRGECTAYGPVRICSRKSSLNAADRCDTAVVEAGAEADYKDLLVTDAVLVQRIIGRSVACVKSEVIVFLYEGFLSVGQSVPCSLGCFAVSPGGISEILYLDLRDQFVNRVRGSRVYPRIEYQCACFLVECCLTSVPDAVVRGFERKDERFAVAQCHKCLGLAECLYPLHGDGECHGIGIKRNRGSSFFRLCRCAYEHFAHARRCHGQNKI